MHRLEAVYVEQRTAMEEVLGLKTLRGSLAKLKPADQVLAIDLRDRDPLEAMTSVPFEKGRLFLQYLDAKFGRERFDAFLRGYFDHFAFKSVNTDQFLSYLQENLLDRYPGIVTRAQVNDWVLKPGLPADAVLPATTAFQVVDDARNSWLSGKEPLKKIGGDWLAQQWIYFLDGMPAALTAAQLTDLDKSLSLSKTPNAEIGHSWFMLVVANDYQPAFAHLENYLETIGRVKFIEPLYQGLMRTSSGAVVAKRVFKKARPGYHPITAKAIEAIVEPKDDSAE